MGSQSLGISRVGRTHCWQRRARSDGVTLLSQPGGESPILRSWDQSLAPCSRRGRCWSPVGKGPAGALMRRKAEQEATEVKVLALFPVLSPAADWTIPPLSQPQFPPLSNGGQQPRSGGHSETHRKPGGDDSAPNEHPTNGSYRWSPVWQEGAGLGASRLHSLWRMKDKIPGWREVCWVLLTAQTVVGRARSLAVTGETSTVRPTGAPLVETQSPHVKTQF